MSSRLLSFLVLLFVSACTNESVSSGDNVAVGQKVSSTVPQKDSFLTTFDTTLTPFLDTSYKLTINIFNTNSYNEENNNSTVTFSHFLGNKAERIFEDSFYCMHPLIDRQDFNNDKVKDILIFYYTGARANPTYHLYLVDSIKYKLTYVKGFEELPNPELDSAKNIITSAALAGADVIWSFYRITPKNELVNLGNGITAEFGDSLKFDKAIKAILKKNK
jgi:hypothetical protein